MRAAQAFLALRIDETLLWILPDLWVTKILNGEHSSNQFIRFLYKNRWGGPCFNYVSRVQITGPRNKVNPQAQQSRHLVSDCLASSLD